MKPFIHRHLQALHFKTLFFYEVQGFLMSPLFIGVSSITLRFFVKNKGLDSVFWLIIEV